MKMRARHSVFVAGSLSAPLKLGLVRWLTWGLRMAGFFRRFADVRGEKVKNPYIRLGRRRMARGSKPSRIVFTSAIGLLTFATPVAVTRQRIAKARTINYLRGLLQRFYALRIDC
jgi:hypothetical protein